MTPGFVLSRFHIRGYSEILVKGGSLGLLAEALRGSAENVFAAIGLYHYQRRLDLFEAGRTQSGPSCEPDIKRSAPTLSSRVGRCGFRRLHIVQLVTGIANLLSRELTYFARTSATLRCEVLDQVNTLDGDGFCVHRCPGTDPPMSFNQQQAVPSRSSQFPTALHRRVAERSSAASTIELVSESSGYIDRQRPLRS